jgi:hypothetical protein
VAAIVCLVALIAAAPTPWPAPTPHADEPTYVPAVRPAHRRGYDARPIHHGDPDLPVDAYQHTLEPGASVSDGVEILNFTEEAAVLFVHATDLEPVVDGPLLAAAHDAEVLGVGAWIAFESERAYVPPRGALVAPFELSVPAGTASGSYVAVILVEPCTVEGCATITFQLPIALRVDVEVLGPIDLGAVLGPLACARTDDGLRFILTVVNHGSETFAADWRVLVDGADEVAVALGPVPDVAPGGAVELSAEWAGPPRLGRVVAQPIVEATVHGRRPRELVGGEVAFWLVPWRDLAVIAGPLLALALLGWVTRVRRRWLVRRRVERALAREPRARCGVGGRSPGATARSPVGVGPLG